MILHKVEKIQCPSLFFNFELKIYNDIKFKKSSFLLNLDSNNYYLIQDHFIIIFYDFGKMFYDLF